MNRSLFSLFMDKALSTDAHEQYLALSFALQIPSICSRIEIPRSSQNSGHAETDPKVYYLEPNGKPIDKRLYVSWLRLHRQQFRAWHLYTMPFEAICCAIYDLRDTLSSAGSLLEAAGKVALVEEGCHLMYSGGRLYIPLGDFCHDMFDVAESVLAPGNEAAVDKYFDNLRAEVVDGVIYDAMKMEAASAYNDFWAGRDDDLQLYKRFCSYSAWTLDQLQVYLWEHPHRGVFGLSMRSLSAWSKSLRM